MSRPVLIGDFLHRIRREIDLNPASLYKLVTVKLKHKGVVLRGEKLGAEIKSKMYQVKEGDFILSGIDARNGAFGIVPPELDGAVVTNDFWYFEIDDEVVDKSFFLELTSTHWFDEICRKGSDGTTQRIRLKKEKFFNQTIYLPELSEQRKFNKRFQAIKASNLTLTSELTHQQTLLKELRQQILQEAIEGKLTADWRVQNPDVEPASELLKRISSEKARLVKDKKIKAQKTLPQITDEEKSFELPQGWEWCRLGQFALQYVDCPHDTPKYEERGILCLRAPDITENGLLLHSIRRVSDEEYEKRIRRLKPEKNDLVYIREGGRLGIAGLIDTEEPVCLGQRVMMLRFFGTVASNYALRFLNAPSTFRNMVSKTIGAASPHVNVRDIVSHTVPIPSLSEQKAIVTKVESLLSLCDQLEIQITQNQTHAEKLMQAVLNEAFSHNSATRPSATLKAAAHA